MTDIKFGTDGWRGLIADDFTFENVRRVAGGIAAYVLRHEEPTRGVVVGYDTRFLAQQAARLAAEVIAGAGIPVAFTSDSTPTPAVSFAVKSQGAAGGVVVTSSHNPWNWNGVKFKGKFGGSATPAVMKVIEAEVSAGSMPKGTPAKIDEADLKTPYVAAITKFADLDKIASKKFADANSTAYQLIKNFQWTNDDQNLVSDYLTNQGMNADQAAEKWVNEHESTWKPWIPAGS